MNVLARKWVKVTGNGLGKWCQGQKLKVVDTDTDTRTGREE